MSAPRRIVTGHDATGKSVILSDGPNPRSLPMKRLLLSGLAALGMCAAAAAQSTPGYMVIRVILDGGPAQAFVGGGQGAGPGEGGPG